MPSQKDITLRQGDASPKDVILYELPIADATTTTIYLTEFDATPNNVILRDPTVQPQAGGPATITGTLAATDGADTASFSGSVIHTITGTLAATDGADVAAFAGAIAHVGTLAATDGSDTAEIIGEVVAVTPTTQATGGIGHGGKKKRIYVRRGEQILVFKDEGSAQNWIEQEQEAEKERQRAEKKPYRPRKVVKLTVKTEPESIIKLPVLERLAESYGQSKDYSAMLRQSDYDALSRIYEKLLQREEEEVLAILLVA